MDLELDLGACGQAAVVDESMERCEECGALVPTSTQPGHDYMPASPGCWAVFGEVQADEYARFGYPEAHRLVVDAYAAQHVGDGSDRRARQSVVVHLVALCATIEHGANAAQARSAIAAVLKERLHFPHLARASGPGALTILDMRGAEDLADYGARARRWAESVWASWRAHHRYVRQLCR